MRTETITIYIAYDGTKFENKEACKKYERTKLPVRLSPYCIFLDDCRKPMSNKDFINDPEKAYGIYVPDAEQAKIVHQILYEHSLASPWSTDEHFTSGYYWYDYEWEDVIKNLTIWKELHKSFIEA